MRALISTNSYLGGEVLNLKIVFTFLRMSSEEAEEVPLDGEASQDQSLRERALCESKEQLLERQKFEGDQYATLLLTILLETTLFE